MSHITEGLLHAHLDGALGTDRTEEWLLAEAHLGVCEDCHRLLDEARRIRDAAGVLLASTSPQAADRPGFDRLVALAGTGPATSRRRQAWWTSTARLAWAASLMLAVGAGWLGRELLIQTGRPVPALVATKQEAAPATEMLDRLAADDALGAVENEAPPESDPVRGVLGERQREAVAEEPRAADSTAVSDMQKLQAEEFRAQVRQDRDEVEQFADNAGVPGDKVVAGRAEAPISAEQAIAAECYTRVQPPQQAAQEGAAEDLFERKIAGAAAAVAPDRLRLAPDGTVTASLDGRNINGTWLTGADDSITVALAGPVGGVELHLVRVESGLSGSIFTTLIPSYKAAAKADVEGRGEVEAVAEAEADLIVGQVTRNTAVSIELAATVCVD